MKQKKERYEMILKILSSLKIDMLLSVTKGIKTSGSCNVKKGKMNPEYISVIYIGWGDRGSHRRCN